MAAHHDLLQAGLIILAQTVGLTIGWIFTEWVKGTDSDEDLDNDKQ